MDITDVFYARHRDEWREWLEANHRTAREIWLQTYHVKSGKERVPYDDAVEEALCFGWIDGLAKNYDHESAVQRYTPRRAKTFLSELNRQRIFKMIRLGKMTQAGLDPIAHLLATSASRAHPDAWDEAARLLEPEMQSPDRMTGTIVGGYRLGRPIGAGGMGTVFEAHDVHLDRKVAIKLLTPAFFGGPDAIRRFQQEARAASMLNHPGIVSLYDAGYAAGQYYITTELVEGRTLRELAAEGPLESGQLMDIAIQVTSALDAAHSAGIIHRDIKPDNVMVRPDGFVKVLDFGLAKLLDSSEPAHFNTRPGFVAGTLQYLSPEQVQHKPATPRSDLFSLGVVLYELATGVRPFDGPSEAAVLDAIVNRTPPLPSQLRPRIDRELESFIMRALEKDPDLRFQTAADFRSCLKRLSQSPGAAEARREPVRRGRPRAIAAAAAVGLLAIGGATWLAVSRVNVPAASRPPVRFDSLTDISGEETFPSLFPDGKQFVYASAREGNQDIFLQRIGGSTSVNLTRECKQDDTQPAISPDGSRIVFRSERDGGGLFVMESTGENPRRISRRGYLPAWAPDGRRVAYSVDNFTLPSHRGAPVSRLFIVDLSDGTERRLETGDAVQPSWSPHGDRIAYWGVPSGGRRDIFTAPASGEGAAVAVTNDDAIDWNPVWSPSGEHLYFISDRGGTMNVWRVAIDERSGRTLGAPEPVTVPAQYVGGLSLSADGGSFIYSRASQSNSLWSIRFDPVRLTASGGPEPAGGGHYVANFSFSPDGSKLVADTIGDNSEDLWVMNLDGSERRRLTSDSYKNRAPEWSPDGQEILFLSDRTGTYENWVIRTDGSGLRPLTRNSHPAMQKAIWSPDGSRVLAASNGLPAFLDPRALSADTARAPVPGIEHAVIVHSWSAGTDGAGLVLGEEGSGRPSPEIVLYSPSRAKLEPTGITGRFPVWLEERAGSDPRYFVFARSSACFLYDRRLRRETLLFSVALNTLYCFRVHRAGGRIYFSQTVRDSDLWRARFDTR